MGGKVLSEDVWRRIASEDMGEGEGDRKVSSEKGQ